MTTKLTLTVEKKVIQKAKNYAKEHGKSLSKIVENHLKLLTAEQQLNELSPVAKELLGSVKDSGVTNYKEALSDSLSKKYNNSK